MEDEIVSDTDRGNFEITDDDWLYLKSVRGVSNEFRYHTIMQQAVSYSTKLQTISLVYGTLYWILCTRCFMRCTQVITKRVTVWKVLQPR